MDKSIAEWTEEDILNLIGQSESARLEFKSIRLLDDIQKAGRDLAKEVSAFANSEGGVIVIGIEETKGGQKTRIAESVVGIDRNRIKSESLQQSLLSNLSPLNA